MSLEIRKIASLTENPKKKTSWLTHMEVGVCNLVRKWVNNSFSMNHQLIYLSELVGKWPLNYKLSG